MKKDYIKNLIDDYSGRAPLPKKESLKDARLALSERAAVSFFRRSHFFRYAAAAAVMLFAASMLLIMLYPAAVTHAENVELAVYIESTLPLGFGEVSDCYDVLKGEITVGAIVTLYVTTDEREGSLDELRVYFEYSSKNKLADSRFDDLPAYSLREESVITVRAFEYNNGEFVTLAAFSDDNIRVCVEIKSSETRQIERYYDIIVMWLTFSEGK